MKRVLTAVLALAFLLCAVTVSTAEVWVGAQGGPSFNSSTITIGPSTFDGSSLKLKSKTGFATGLALGYNFGDAGQPDWSKYFGVQMDVSYNSFNFVNDGSPYGKAFGYYATRGFPAERNISGDTIGLVFLAKGRLPLMADRDYPRGRVQPYVGVGPGVMFNSFDNTSDVASLKSTTNVALVAETGVSYFVTPRFSTKLAYRFQHQFDSDDTTYNGLPVKYDVNNHQAIVGVSYHF